MCPQFGRIGKAPLLSLLRETVRHVRPHGMNQGVPVRPASNWAGTFAVVLAVIGMLLGSTASPVSAQDWSPPRTVWVEDAGHTIDGYFLDLWRDYPELLGQPITEEWQSPISIENFDRDDRYVQYFEHMA